MRYQTLNGRSLLLQAYRCLVKKGIIKSFRLNSSALQKSPHPDKLMRKSKLKKRLYGTWYTLYNAFIYNELGCTKGVPRK